MKVKPALNGSSGPAKSYSVGELVFETMHGFEFYGPSFACWLQDQNGGRPVRYKKVEPGEEQILPPREQRELDGIPSLCAAARGLERPKQRGHRPGVRILSRTCPRQRTGHACETSARRAASPAPGMAASPSRKGFSPPNEAPPRRPAPPKPAAAFARWIGLGLLLRVGAWTG